MNESQEIPRTCENCNFSQKAPQTTFNDIPDPEQVKCSKDGHYHNATDEACSEWNPRCHYYNSESEENKRCELLGPIGGSTGTYIDDRTWVGQKCVPESCSYFASQLGTHDSNR